MADINALLTTLRDFLHQESPTEEARQRIYGVLRNHMEHQDVWLPMFKEHPLWSKEPLIWAHIEGMGPGMMPQEVYGPWSEEISAYAAVLPDLPIKLIMRGGNGSNYSHQIAPKELARRCVHLCIDRPMWSYDGGQDGYGSGSCDIRDIIDQTLHSLKGQLRALHTLTFNASECSEYHSTDAEPSRYYRVTTLQGKGWNQASGFLKFKKLVNSRRLLRHITISNKDPLSGLRQRDRFKRDGTPKKPLSGWLAKCSWWPQLESLDLNQNQLLDCDMAWLFPAPMPELKTLNLSQNKLGNTALRTLKKKGFFPSLVHLDLQGNGITPDKGQALLGNPNLPNLKTLLV